MYCRSGNGLFQLDHGEHTINIADGKVLRREVSWDEKSGWQIRDIPQ
jgi:hypothetical protein